MSFLPGMFPAGALAAATPPVGPSGPASIIFNGASGRLYRDLVTSGASTTIFTYSVWVKVTVWDDLFGLATSDAFTVTHPDPANFDTHLYGAVDDDGPTLSQTAGGSHAWGESVLGSALSTGIWNHFVYRYDSTQGTADNRVRLYLNGALLSDTNITPGGAPSANEAHTLFQNGLRHYIKSDFADDSGGTVYGNSKIAFIDVLEGISAEPTAFASSNGGVWTRRPYVGSRGTYGFSLDGSNGFNDVSGNNQHFTPANMTTAANLDPNDLPPFIT